MALSQDIPLDHLLTFGLGCCLCFAGLVILMRQARQGCFLSVCLLTLGATMIVPFLLAKAVASLMIWPAYYLHVRQRHHRIKWHPFIIMHFLLAFLWGLMQLLSPQTIEQWFDSLAFLQWIPYVLLSLVELYRQYRSAIFKRILRASFAQWAFWGFLIVILTRLLFPIIPVGDFSIQFSFDGLFGLYLLCVFSFYVHGPFEQEEWAIELEKEARSNYEEELKRQLDVLLKKEKVFVIPDLTLQELSHKMNIKSAALSGFFSASLGRNFNEIINEHRVEEVKRLMNDPNTDPKSTLMELAYQSGFNSKATFNRIFKEMTGMTPKAFKAQAVG